MAAAVTIAEIVKQADRSRDRGGRERLGGIDPYADCGPVAGPGNRWLRRAGKPIGHCRESPAKRKNDLGFFNLWKDYASIRLSRSRRNGQTY
jgi:hypothetical protein